MRASYGKTWRKRRNAAIAALKPASGAAEASADSDSDEEGDQFFFAYSPAPETDSVKEGRASEQGYKMEPKPEHSTRNPGSFPHLMVGGCKPAGVSRQSPQEWTGLKQSP